MHTVYVLENQNDKSWHIGQTDNLKRRIEEHNSKQGGPSFLLEKSSYGL